MKEITVEREQYIRKLILWKDKRMIKVITGIRRSGKSTLLQQFRAYLLQDGVKADQIIEVNFERIENEPLTEYHALYEYVTDRISNTEMHYIFLDEIQMVPEFQRVVDSLFLRENVDLYITGSNAYMLSGELATLLSGRYVEIQLLPLSFAEYCRLTGYDRRDAWPHYFTEGGFPYAATLTDEDIRRDYMQGIYSTVLIKDIIGRKKIQDVPLLESVVRFAFDNIGNTVSSKKIADTLSSNGRKTTSATVENYLRGLMESFILYKVYRYDIKGRQHLKSLEKYYLVDMGFRRMLLGNAPRDVGHILENIIFLELSRRGYAVYIGKYDNLEVDFVAENGSGRLYVQVAASIMDESVYEREMLPLKKIKDNYPKIVITLDEIPMEEDGIRQVNAVDFLLGEADPV